MYLFRLITVSRFVFRFFRVQKNFNSSFLPRYLQPFEQKFGKGLSSKTIDKIRRYYCLGIPATCASYKKIYGKSLSYHERELATLTGIITPIIDDFTDEKTLDHAGLEALTSNPMLYDASALEESVVKSTLCTLLQKVPSPEGFLYALNRTIKAQHFSELQMQKSTPREELLAITLEKGAWSHIFFHYLLDEIPGAATIEVMHQMGGMLQMSNDIFDVYKDQQEGFYTVPNTCANYGELKEYYLRECRKFCRMARTLPFQKAGLEFFITFIAFVMARGLVALNMLEKLQEENGGGVLPYEKLERKQLICDMEKPVSALKTAWQTWRIVAR